MLTEIGSWQLRSSSAHCNQELARRRGGEEARRRGGEEARRRGGKEEKEKAVEEGAESYLKI